MRDLDMDHHMAWAERWMWMRITSVIVAIFAFVMFALLALPLWVWGLGWILLMLSLVAYWRLEYHRREIFDLLQRSYTEPWWLSGDGGHMKIWRRH